VSGLSIVTPVYNSGAYLEQLLDSVAAISTPHEHIVIDGGSNDGTVQLLRDRDDASLVWISEPDRGQTHAVNKGLGRATLEYVNWINGDNAYMPGAIDAAVAYLDAHPEVAAVFGGIDFIDEQGVFRRRYVPSRWRWQRYLFLGDYVPTETIIFRRSLLADVAPLDERFADAADYDFYLRLFHGRLIERRTEPMIFYRYHPASKTARDPWLAQSEHRVIREQWARGSRDRAIMAGLDWAKRTLLPLISPWPKPYET
jgi:GT2 family glycosyltransferase